jgi:hypothetical protein
MTSTKQQDQTAFAFSLFAVVALWTLGLMQFWTGLVGVVDGDASLYGLQPNDQQYLLDLSGSTWGWIHLVMGVLLFAAGSALVYGRTWARIVGITVATMSAVVCFAFIPVYPFWGIVLMVIAVSVIWSLTTYGKDLRR